MSTFKDITNQRFGRLIALERFGSGQPTLWLCQCDCGNKKNINARSLVTGGTRSCGCIRFHGKTYTPEWYSWISMIQRCNDPNYHAYKWYGGRGIKVCERWLKFKNFFADMGERPKGMTLDRVNNDFGYFPINCRWATPSQQAKNRRQNKKNGLTGRYMSKDEDL